jgi:hypothetical protein
MNLLPKNRNENIIMQDAGNEVLIYDTTTDKAYCLNETSAKVFNACDGATSFDELKSKYQFTDDLIYLTLDELQAKNLLDSSANYETPFAGMSRREVIRKVGLATMIALPVVAGIIAPQAANAASGNNRALLQTCTASSQCTSNRCTVTNSGTQRCCASTNTNQPQEPGTNLGGTSNSTCTNIIGPQYCCSGSATNNPNGTAGCVCN